MVEYEYYSFFPTFNVLMLEHGPFRGLSLQPEHNLVANVWHISALAPFATNPVSVCVKAKLLKK
jgi:hypothetical protein